jgi:hypothetical protein
MKRQNQYALVLFACLTFGIAGCGDSSGPGNGTGTDDDQDDNGGSADNLSVEILSGPGAQTIHHYAVIEFEADDAAGFECSFDYGPFEACSSPFTRIETGMGDHRFEVRALDEDNRASLPATHEWTVVSVFDQVPEGELRTTDHAPTEGGPGAFRLVCEVSHGNYDDPIVFPGEQDRAHMHLYFGNKEADFASTTESLFTTGSGSCHGGFLNRSAYWVPTLMIPEYDEHGSQATDENGDPAWELVLPMEGWDSVHVYYKNPFYADPSQTQPMPTGLRMIAGDATASPDNEDEILHGRWSCDSWDIVTGQEYTNYIPECSADDSREGTDHEILNAAVRFPSCWDGENLDLPDHKSHMAYRIGGDGGTVCPDSHPVQLPEVKYNFRFAVTHESTGPHGTTSDWRLASDMYPASDGPGGHSLHGDWWMAWHPEIMNVWVAHCLQTPRDCASGNLGNGWTMHTMRQGSMEFPEIINQGHGPHTDGSHDSHGVHGGHNHSRMSSH